MSRTRHARDVHVIVHGGAGGVPDAPDPRQAVLDEAAETGAAAQTPLEAVEAAVNVLESDVRFNAGVGGAVQSDGVVRTDAGVMTSDREAGAVAGMEGVEHAVSVARVVAEETPHVFVAGEHAVDLAADFGVETDVDLFTDDTRTRWEDADPPQGSPSEHLRWLESRFGGSTSDPTAESDDGDRVTDAGADLSDHPDSDDDGGDLSDHPDSDDVGVDLSDHDTVGAVAFDGEQFAAATSTGGRWFALAGRVGDVPQIGSGFYAAPAGAASATGAGEDIAKVTLSRRAVRHLEAGMSAQRAAETAIDEFGELTGSSAGVIVLDGEGGAGSAFNSDGMQTSVARE